MYVSGLNGGYYIWQAQKRSEWVERMAEGINHIKQKILENVSGRPDYTFFLSNNLKAKMDVNFPSTTLPVMSAQKRNTIKKVTAMKSSRILRS